MVEDRRAPRRLDGMLTDFATAAAASFVWAGLTSPPKIIEIPPVQFYSVLANGDRQPRTLALQEHYRGNYFQPLTEIAVFKPGIPPRLGDGHNAIDFPPVRQDDVEYRVSVGAIADAEHLSTPMHWIGSYFLTKWPGFSRLLADHKADDPASPIPFISTATGVTIAPFQGRNAELYFIYDQYLALGQIKRLSNASGDDGLVLVQRLGAAELDDVCYLVVAPSKLATTLETENAK